MYTSILFWFIGFAARAAARPVADAAGARERRPLQNLWFLLTAAPPARPAHPLTSRRRLAWQIGLTLIVGVGLVWLLLQ